MVCVGQVVSKLNSVVIIFQKEKGRKQEKEINKKVEKNCRTAYDGLDGRNGQHLEVPTFHTAMLFSSCRRRPE